MCRGWGCAKQPGVYARVSNGYDWIRGQVCHMSPNLAPSSFNCNPQQQQPQNSAPYQRPFNGQALNPSPAPPTLPLTESPTFPPTIPPTSLPTSPPTPPPPPEIQRAELPSYRSCSIASQSREVCCSAKMNQLNSNGQGCLPAINTVQGDRTCQTVEFTQLNIGKLDMLSCDDIIQERILLAAGKTCSTIQSKAECCQHRDNRNDGSIYDGQPCVASRANSFPQGLGVCQPANYVAENIPGSAMSCEDVIEETSGEPDVSEFSESFSVAIVSREGYPRSYLPEGRQCRGISNVHVCCAALDSRNPNAVGGGKYRGEPCAPASNSNGGFSSGRVCEPTLWAFEFDLDSYDANFCKRLVDGRLETSSCSDIDSARNCCKYRNSDGEACLPSQRPLGFLTGNQCEAASWVAAHEPTNVEDCSI